jgi:uncharacterized PurR-regulated membrane protein YhhQ (DUF165 family)
MESHKSRSLFVFLGAVFVANALLAEFIGVKIFSLEQTLGIPLSDFSLFGKDHLSFNMTAGVLLWPVVFIMTDIINEYFVIYSESTSLGSGFYRAYRAP